MGRWDLVDWHGDLDVETRVGPVGGVDGVKVEWEVNGRWVSRFCFYRM